mmetsp:Transcript_72359/g.120595  ORF Transcript_72359/g.120595 Transcript_72359/m.120595 type:complete len:204 (-) Transcript_72359:72-683(-)
MLEASPRVSPSTCCASLAITRAHGRENLTPIFAPLVNLCLRNTRCQARTAVMMRMARKAKLPTTMPMPEGRKLCSVADSEYSGDEGGGGGGFSGGEGGGGDGGGGEGGGGEDGGSEGGDAEGGGGEGSGCNGGGGESGGDEGGGTFGCSCVDASKYTKRITIWRRLRFCLARVLNAPSAPWLSSAAVTLPASADSSKGPTITS